MKIFVLIMLATSFCCFERAYSQNLNETFQWIKIAVETNSYNFMTISSDSTALVITAEPSSKSILGIKQTISFKKIQSAQFVQDDDLIRLELKCTSDQCVSVELKNKEQSDWTFGNNAVYLVIPFKKDIDADIKKRIVTAFNHLIILEGGKVLDKTF